MNYGKVKIIVVPFVILVSIEIVTLRSSHNLFTIDSPKPVPFTSECSKLLDLKKALNILSLSSAKIPKPLSEIPHLILPFSVNNFNTIDVLLLEYF